LTFAEKSATAAEKSASAVEAFTTLKQKRGVRGALKEATEEESDEEEKGELKVLYKKAKRAYLDACDPEVKWELRANMRMFGCRFVPSLPPCALALGS